MADDLTDGGASAGDSGEGGDGGSPELADLEAVAAEFDAGVVAGEGEESPATDAEEDGGERRRAGAPTPIDAELQEYIDQNYGGDVRAFLHAQYQSREEGKRLAQEVADLRTKVSATPPRDTAAEAKAAVDQSADVQTIDQEIQLIDADTNQINQTQLQLSTRAGELQQLIAKVQGELVHADDVDKGKLRYDLAAAQSEMENLKTQFRSNERFRLQNEQNKRYYQRERLKIESDIRASIEAEERERQSVQEYQGEVKQEFDAAFIEEAKNYGLDATSKDPAMRKRVNYVYQSVKAQTVNYIDAVVGRGSRTIPIPKTVQRLMAEAADAGLISRVGQKPKPRAMAPTPRPVLTPPAPRRPVAPPGRSSTPPRPRSTDDVLSDPDLVRQRAEKLFEQAARRAGNRG